MAGHSHWARIKRAKGANDAKRGRQWSRLSRAIIVAARAGGGDPDMNLSLRYAIDAARDANMPKDTIERAIKKGSGDGAGSAYEEMIFEGYGPGGAAILCICLTDNRNRTAPEIKKIFEMRNGKLGQANSVARMFTKRGVFIVSTDQADEDTLTNIALDVGAEDVKSLGDAFELTCDPGTFNKLRQALEAAKIKPESAELSMIASTTVELSGDDAERMLKLFEALEEHEDTQNVHSNFSISDADMERLSAE